MECRKRIVITPDFPITLKYAEVPRDQECPPPVIGDVQAALKEKIRALCAEGECEDGPCVPESPNVISILRQVGQFSNVVGDRRECFVSIVAEANTRCICEGSDLPPDPHGEPDDAQPPGGTEQGDSSGGCRCCFSTAAGAFATASASAFANTL